jgi:ABC-2 type transport system ATP-binding protein
VAGEVEQLLAVHAMLTGPAAAADDLSERLAVVHARRAGTVAQLLVRNSGPAEPAPSGWEAGRVSLEELVLAYLREPGAAALPGPAGATARATHGAPA